MAHLARYKESHPTVFVVTHWINMICCILLIISGLLIHFPFIPNIMGICRGVHITCGIILIVNLIVRIILAFFVKDTQVGGTRKGLDRDIKNFLPSDKNKGQLLSWIKYYLFLKKDHPTGTKFGSLQKLCYFLVPFLILALGLTGLCLWGTTSSWGLCTWLTNLVGGAMNMRIIHYTLMWVMIVFIIIHVYLATIEGKADVNMMLFHKESPGMVTDPETGKVIGKDEMGMGPLGYEDEIEGIPEVEAEEEEKAAE